MFSLKVNNSEIGDIITITKVDRGLTPEIEHTAKNYDMRDGSLYQHTKYNSRDIEVEYAMVGNLASKKDVLTRTLTKDSLKVIFGDEPDRYYLCKLTGKSEFEKLSKNYAKGSFTLRCFEPFSFSTTEKSAIKNRMSLTFNNNGTAPTYPIFKFIATAPLSMIALTHPNGRVIQYGYDGNTNILNSGDVVIIDTGKCTLTVNGVRKYITPASRWFKLNNGISEIGITINTGGTLPTFSATFQEAYL